MDTNVFNELRSAIAAAEEAKAREAAARDAVLRFLTESGEKGSKLPWANISVVNTPVWEYRDGGVTSAKADVAKAETTLKQAKALLKGAQDAAKAAGGSKARIIDTATTLRIVKVAAQ
jgi:hypothetical protein